MPKSTCVLDAARPLRKKFDVEITIYQQGANQRQHQITEANTGSDSLQEKINTQLAIILANQARTKNVDTAVNRINARLQSFGLEGFHSHYAPCNMFFRFPVS